jgi:hypothetical protein
MADRRYKLIGNGLPGTASFPVADLAGGNFIEWNATTGKWEISGSIIGGGTTKLYHSGADLALETDTLGVNILPSTTGSNPGLFLQDSSKTDRTRYYATATSSGIRGELNSMHIHLEAYNASSALKSMADFDPDGSASLYYAGTKKFGTRTDGVDIGTNLEIIESGDHVFYRNTSATGSIYFRVNTSENAVVALANGAVSAYFNNTKAFETHGGGISIFDTSGNDPYIAFYQDDTTTRGGYIQTNSTTGFIFQHEVHGSPVLLRAENAGGTNKTLLSADPDASCDMHYAGSWTVRTTANGGDIRPNTAANCIFRILDNSAVLKAQIFHQTAGAGGLYIDNVVNGKEFHLRTYDSGGTARSHIKMGRNATGTSVAFHSSTPIAKPTVTGSRGGNAALASLLTALANYGLITNSTT